MAIAERVIKYSVRVDRTDIADYTRLLELQLESGTTVWLEFDPQLQGDWLAAQHAASSS